MVKYSGTFARITAIILILYGLYLLILLTLPYFALERNTDFLKTKQSIIHLDYFRWAFYLHIFSSPVLVLTGLFQFSKKILNRFPAFHRLSGKIYLIVLLFISAPGALVLAWYANGYVITKISFLLLTILWIVFSVISYIRIRQRQFESHGNFLLRGYALTLSAITLRFYAYLLAVFHSNLPPKDAYLLIALLSWIPNLVVAEWMIRRGFIRRILNTVRFHHKGTKTRRI